VKYEEGTGSFEVRISYDALPYFFDLKKNFTRFQLKSALSCDARYAKRIYTIACQWRSKGLVYGREGRPYLTFEEIKERLDINTEYRLNGDLKKRVLELARKQINENTDINIEYEYLKRGRSFFAVKILVNPVHLKQIDIPFDDEKEMKRLKAISSFAGYGIAENAVDTMLDKGTATKAWKLLQEIKGKISTGKISMPNDIGAYLVGAFKKKGFI